MEHLPDAFTKRALDLDLNLPDGFAIDLVDCGEFNHYAPLRLVAAHCVDRARTRDADCFDTVKAPQIFINYLYFQLIARTILRGVSSQSQVFNQAIRDFVVRDLEGHLKFSTIALIDWMRKHHAHIEAQNSQEKLNEIVSDNSDLARVRLILSYSTHRDRSTWPLPAGSTLAIVLLLETMEHGLSAHDVCISNETPPQSSPCNPKHDMRVPKIEDLILSQPWCPNQINMCRNRFNWSTLIYASQLIRPILRNHISRCTPLKCTAYDMETAKQKVNHVHPSCTCSYIYSPLDTINTLISSNSIPLIRLPTTTLSLPTHCTIDPLAPSTPYIAFSHVWSQSLGHDLGNFLPTCQFTRLVTYAMRLSPTTTHLWVDILCVPRTPTQSREIGITQIKSVFEQAEHVLVLEEELVNSTFEDTHWEEMLVRINVSRWMRRLWTLHEAVLARRLSFQFGNRPVSLEEVSAKVQREQLRWNIVGDVALQTLTSPAALREESDGAVRMARLWNLLRWRSTSWPEQETVCLANILNPYRAVPVDLARVPVEGRMGRFLRLYDEYPAELVFMEGPRVEERGFGWSPRSWLVREETYEQQRCIKLDGVAVGKRSEEGLVVPYLGMCLDMKVRDVEQGLKMIFDFDGELQGHAKAIVSVPQVFDAGLEAKKREFAGCYVAFICDEHTRPWDPPYTDARTGALVAVTAAEGDSDRESESMAISTRFLSTVKVSFCNIDATEADSGSWNSAGGSKCEVLFQRRRWCIG